MSKSEKKIKSDPSDNYKKMDQREHILYLPDSYIGSVNLDTTDMWIYDKETNKIVKKNIEYVPGFYKTVDELIVNARDHQIRDNTCKKIKLSFDMESGKICVWNDGNGIPVVIHTEHNIYIPELIFGHLLTSSNYHKKGKIVGGKNGYGAKLANIYSKKFIVETVDAKTCKKYIQEFRENMTEKDEPTIENVSKDTKPYTKITYYPDYKRFKMNGLTEDVYKLLSKRAYDISACTNEKVHVYLNDELIKVKNFDDFIKLHYSTEPTLIYDEVNPRWKVGIVYSQDSGGDQISFVNGVWTYQGGEHVEYIMKQIVDKVRDNIKSKHKDLNIKPTQIREHLTVYIDSVIDDPAFTSQTKGELKTKPKDFGTECEIDNVFINKIVKTGLTEIVIKFAQFKEMSGLKQTDGKKTSDLNVEKHEKAHWAGTRKSKETRLILTEGDSAKAFAISGLKIVGRERYGVFPLKGKLLNVRNATASKIKGNEEFKNIKKIMGLKQDSTYNDVGKLNYGGIIILTDQDSVTSDTPLLLRNSDKKCEIRTIDDINIDWKQNLNGKEFSTSDYEVWTENGWTKITNVIRHKVSKRIFRVLTQTGVVDVTEDHSLLDKNGEKISPKKCKVNNELLHSFPKFEENRVIIPDNFNNLTMKELWSIANQIKIRNYQLYNRESLINIIDNYNESEFIKFEIVSEIDQFEAYVMGLFFANGLCRILSYDTIDDPNIYKMSSCVYVWSIMNTNLDILNKAKKILEETYNYKFNIMEYTYDHNLNGSKICYKLVINDHEHTKQMVNKYLEMFYDKDLQKKIPLDILNSSYNVRRNFFNGYYDGDGCKKSIAGTEYFDVDGKISAHGLYFLGKSLGYDMTISIIDSSHEIYTLLITKGTHSHPYIIKKIIDLGITEQYVYDLETENHHFQAGIGQMIVHNTDGDHITGLIINMFQFFWPELLKINGFINRMTTPLIKAFKKSDSKKKNPKVFYSESDYRKWFDGIETDSSKWTIKYYKGLGTSTEKEAREVFNEFDNRVASFLWEKVDGDNLKKIDNDSCSSDESDDEKSNKNKMMDQMKDKTIYGSKSYDSVTLAFDKDRADDRKKWLTNWNREDVLEYNTKSIKLSDFINKGFIFFSNDDNIRSIPSLVDGHKPSQRKIMYACFKKGQKSEIKVAQLASYVAEHTAYKHGEASLQEAIISMAQGFPGSNNIHLLYPSGNFGFRKQGGKEAASPRYIFTYIDPITFKIYRKEDESILNYLVDEGEVVEPEFYCPIIPMILVNGSQGVGTGFSTNVPQYNPQDICENIMRRMDGKEMVDMDPWYYGFNGDIICEKTNKYRIVGKYKIVDTNTVKITEIPIKGLCWTDDYHEFLNSLKVVDKNDKKHKILSVVSNCGNNEIDFEVEFRQGELQKFVKAGEDGLIKFLKLSSNMSVSNLHMYNTEGKMTLYESPIEIMEEFYEYRLKMYGVRKKKHLKLLNNELEILKNKVRFIEDILNKKIIIEKKKKDDIIDKLIEKSYPKLSHKIDACEEEKTYNYLTDMQLFSLTYEKIEELNKQYNEKKKEHDDYNSTTEMQLWRRELNEFMEFYDKWLINRKEEDKDDGIDSDEDKPKKSKKKSVVKKK